MHRVQFSGEIKDFMGKSIEPIQYSGEADQYDSVQEAQASEDWPSPNETLKIVNQKKLAAEKASKYQAATKDLRKAYENSDEYKHANLIKALSLMLPNKSAAELEALAQSMEAA